MPSGRSDGQCARGAAMIFPRFFLPGNFPAAGGRDFLCVGKAGPYKVVPCASVIVGASIARPAAGCSSCLDLRRIRKMKNYVILSDWRKYPIFARSRRIFAFTDYSAVDYCVDYDSLRAAFGGCLHTPAGAAFDALTLAQDDRCFSLCCFT